VVQILVFVCSVWMMVEPVPDLGLVPGELADGWTSVLFWNWYPMNRLMVGPMSWFGTVALWMGLLVRLVFWNGIGALRMGDQ